MKVSTLLIFIHLNVKGSANLQSDASLLTITCSSAMVSADPDIGR